MVIKVNGLLVGPQCGRWAHKCSGPGAYMRLLMHVDKSGHRFRFDCSGRSRKDLQAMSVVAEQPREEKLDGSSWNLLRRGGFAAELGLWMLRDWKPYHHRVRSQRGSHSPVRISGFQRQTGHTNNWAKVRSAHCSCAKAAVVRTGRAKNIHWNARTSGYAAFTVVYAFHAHRRCDRPLDQL